MTANLIACVMLVAFLMIALSVAMQDLPMALLWWGGFNATFLAWRVALSRRERS